MFLLIYCLRHDYLGALPCWESTICWLTPFGLVIQWQRSGSTLPQVRAWCWSATSHYLNQCWLTIKGVLWHSHESNFTRSAHDLNPKHVFIDYMSQITTTSPRGQWVRKHSVALYANLWPKCCHVCYWMFLISEMAQQVFILFVANK